MQIKKFLNISLDDSLSDLKRQTSRDNSSTSDHHSGEAAQSLAPVTPHQDSTRSSLLQRSEVLQNQVSETFPGFEKSSGWRLHSSYSPMPTPLHKKLTSFFKPHNQKLFDLIEEDYSNWWA